MTVTTPSQIPRKRRFGSRLRALGSFAPVFPGTFIDVNGRLPDTHREDAVWHRNRAKEMLRAHPEIKELIGRDPLTAFWCLLMAGTQIGLAVWTATQPWWVMVIVAYVAGAIININLFNLVHECNHGTVFKKNITNMWLFTFGSLPMFLPGHHTWWAEHHMHHNDLGANKKDFVTRRRHVVTYPRSRRPFGLNKGTLLRILNGLATPLFLPFSFLILVMQYLRRLPA